MAVVAHCFISAKNLMKPIAAHATSKTTLYTYIQNQKYVRRMARCRK